MTTRIVPVQPFDLVIFGGTGDRAHRKIFPALLHRFHDRQFGPGSRILSPSAPGVGRELFANFRASVGSADKGASIFAIA